MLKQVLKAAAGGALLNATVGYRRKLQTDVLLAGIAAQGWQVESLDMSDEQAAVHFANETYVDEFNRLAIRAFHEYKIRFLKRTLTQEYIATHTFLEVGDSDGLVLKSLGKPGFSVNNDPRCIELIRSNGVECVVGLGEGLGVPDKSHDVAMAFETLEHSLNPLAFLEELVRTARESIVISIPGVTRTFVHPRVRGQRVGEEHVFEFCSQDLLNLTTHLPLRLARLEKFSVFAPPTNPAAAALYYATRESQLFGGCFRWFDFYVFDLVDGDQGLSRAETVAVYERR